MQMKVVLTSPCRHPLPKADVAPDRVVVVVDVAVGVS